MNPTELHDGRDPDACPDCGRPHCDACDPSAYDETDWGDPEFMAEHERAATAEGTP